MREIESKLESLRWYHQRPGAEAQEQKERLVREISQLILDNSPAGLSDAEQARVFGDFCRQQHLFKFALAELLYDKPYWRVLAGTKGRLIKPDLTVVDGYVTTRESTFSKCESITCRDDGLLDVTFLRDGWRLTVSVADTL